MADSIRVQTSRASRTLLVRIDGGELNARLRALASEKQVRFGAIRGRGVLEDPGVLAFDAARGEYVGSRQLQGAFEVASIEGWVVTRGGGVEIELSAILQQSGATHAGRLTGGRVKSLALSLECWDDADPNALEPGASSATSAGAVTVPKTLADAARALEGRAAELPDPHEDDVARPEPEPGDYLDHPSFGIVELESEEESGRVRIKLANGSRREIMLDVFDVVSRESRDGKKFFSLRPRRR